MIDFEAMQKKHPKRTLRIERVKDNDYRFTTLKGRVVRVWKDVAGAFHVEPEDAHTAHISRARQTRIEECDSWELAFQAADMCY